MIGHTVPMMARPRALVLLSLVMLLASLAWAPVVSAASTLYVALSPAATGGGSCAAPDYNDIQSAVTAAVAGDTVHICAGTYALTATVSVGVDLTIAGDAAASTIVDGGGTVGLFNSSGSLSVSDLTLQNGFTDFGGAIFASGAITAMGSIFSDNHAGDDGGAIWATEVTITTSTLSGNSSSGFFGGAVRAEGGNVTVSASTFSGNSIASGAPFFLGFGGAINTNGAVTTTNSTFSGNTAVAGGAIVAGTFTATNSTFSGNTGDGGDAFFVGGAATIANSILAHASATTNCGGGGTITDGGGNFSTDASCGLTQPTSQVVTPAELALGSLAANGGPTQTIALGAASVARDAGIDAVCATAPVSGLDQRGITRPQGAHCDSGAYEFVAPVPPPAPAPTPVPLTLTKGVGTTQAGPFAATLSAPLGSTVWYALSLTNTGSSALTGISLVDSATAGALPAGCPALPASLAATAVYNCTYSASVTSGTTTNTATASVGGSSVSATATVTAGPPLLTDAIASGVNRGSSGFGTASVVLDQPGYVTFLVRLEPSLAGRTVELWTRTKTGAWTRTTSRLVGADGTVHYYRKINGWTGFWAKLADGASHGRIGTVR